MRIEIHVKFPKTKSIKSLLDFILICLIHLIFQLQLIFEIKFLNLLQIIKLFT